MKFVFSKLADFLSSGRIRKVQFNPLDFPSVDFRAQLQASTTYDPEFYFLEIENVLVKGGDFSLYFDDTNRALCEGLVFSDIENKCREGNTVLIDDILLDSTPIVESSMLLGSNSNYYHWLINYAPRLMFYGYLPYRIPISVSQTRPAFVDQFIYQLIGYPGPLVDIPHRGFVRFRRLFVPAFFQNPIHSPTALSFLRRGVNRCGHHIFSEAKNELVYLSRADGGERRNLQNETEVRNCLESIGFRTFIPSHATVYEQIDTFSRAKVIVAPHGAGLANLVFAQKGVRVLEIQSSECFTKVFWELSKLVGSSKYNIFSCDPVSGDKRHKNHKNINVDIKKLLREVESLIKD